MGWCISDTVANEVIELFLGCKKARSPYIESVFDPNRGRCILTIATCIHVTYT